MTAPHDEDLDRLKQEVASLKEENAFLRSLLDSLTDGILVMDPSYKTLFSNKASDRILRGQPVADPTTWQSQFGTFLPDMKTPFPPQEFPLVKALAGEDVRGCPIVMRVPEEPDPVWLECNAWPLRDEKGAIWGGLCTLQDVTARRKLEEDLAARTEALMASEAQNVSLIGRLQVALRELSTPMLEVWDGVLALPVIGVVDSQRSAEMMERLLHEVSRSRTRFVILDLTGVDAIDTQTANHFLRVAQAVKLLGATCVLTGIRPAIAQTMVSLGADLAIATLRNLKHGLDYCLRQIRAERAASAATVTTAAATGAPGAAAAPASAAGAAAAPAGAAGVAPAAGIAPAPTGAAGQ